MFSSVLGEKNEWIDWKLARLTTTITFFRNETIWEFFLFWIFPFQYYLLWNFENIFFTLLGFKENKVFLKYFYILIFCLRITFQQFIDNDNPTVASDMASKNIFTASNFWRDYGLYSICCMSSHAAKENLCFTTVRMIVPMLGCTSMWHVKNKQSSSIHSPHSDQDNNNLLLHLCDWLWSMGCDTTYYSSMHPQYKQFSFLKRYKYFFTKQVPPCINYMQYPWGYALPVSHIISTRESYPQYPWGYALPVSHIISTREDMQYPWVISSVPMSHPQYPWGYAVPVSHIISTRESYPQYLWGHSTRESCPQYLWVISSVPVRICSTRE